MNKFDRLTISVQVTANSPLSKGRWDEIHAMFTEAIEDRIMESDRLRDELGHVHLGSPFDTGREICV